MKNNSTLCEQTHMSKCTLLQPFILNLVFSSRRLHGHVLPEDIMAWEEKALFWDHIALLQSLPCIYARWDECRSGLMQSYRPGQSQGRWGCLLPQWNHSPCDSRLLGKGWLFPCSVLVPSKSPVILPPGLVKVQPVSRRQSSETHCSASPAHAPCMARRR